MTNAPHRTNSTRRCATAALTLTGVAVIAACSSSGTTSSSGTSAPAASASGTNPTAPSSATASVLPCAQITALRSTLTDLSHTSVGFTSAGRIVSDLSKAEQELNALKSQAGPFSAQANQLSSELSAIKTNAAALANSPTFSNLSNLRNAITSFKSTSEPLIKEMQTACP